MSINSAMLAGVSGLSANSSSLAAISDNIANLNTTGYKRSQVNFANVVTAQATNIGRYSAGGVQGVTRQYVSQQGLIQNTSTPTDLAIAGEGFFIVSDKGANLSSADTRLFTRAGSFNTDSEGYLKNDAGLYLLAWPVQDDGTFEVDPSDLTRLQPINVRNLGAAVRASENVAIVANVNSQTTYDPAVTYTAGAMSAYADDPTAATGVKPNFEVEMNVVDSQGGTHRLTVGMLRKDPATNPNEWHAEIYGSPDEVTGTNATGLLKSGSLVFTADGKLDLTASTLFGAATGSPPVAAPAKISIGASGSGTAPNWGDALGVGAQTLNFDLAGLTQYNSPSTVKSVNPDGATLGNVTSVEVDDKGFISAVFDNSEIRKIGKVALATFQNADGLSAVSGTAYRATLQSGEFTIKEAGVSGAGLISPASLESSTVDLSAEFTGLITTQKAYSACSKIITTADDMLTELINIRR